MCLSTLEDVIEGDFFSDTESDDEKRLYLDVERTLTHENGGGVNPLKCRWSTKAPDDDFVCFMYDIRRAEGYVHLYGGTSGTKGRSPLAHPFLSFTSYLPDFNPASDDRACTDDLKKFVVFRHEETDYIRTEVDDGETVYHDLDLIAAVPCGKDVRRTFSGTGWWSMDEVNGAELLVMR